MEAVWLLIQQAQGAQIIILHFYFILKLFFVSGFCSSNFLPLALNHSYWYVFGNSF